MPCIPPAVCALLVLALVLPAACAAPAPVPSARDAIVLGESRNVAVREFGQHVQDVWLASLQALVREGYVVSTGLDHTEHGGVVEVGDVELRVTDLGSRVSEVRVRVGRTQEDEHLSRANGILEAIEGRLGR